jgi:replicative DNA helicase
MGDIAKALDKLDVLEQEWMTNQSDVWGTSTGFPSIDKLTGGFHNGEVFVLGARTSHGKTALATQMMFAVVDEIAHESKQAGYQTGQVLAFSPEMSAHMLMLRQASVISGVPSSVIRTGTATEIQMEAWTNAKRLLRIYDPYVVLRAQGDMSVQEISTLVETKHSASGIETKLVVIDYIQYLTSASGRDNSYEQVSGVTKEVKDMANHLDVPVLLLSQMNRKAAQSQDDEAEDVPELHELEGSGKIEARADSVGLLWRPNRITDQPDSEPQKALLRIGKNRNGPVGIVHLFYYPDLTRFRDPEHPE